MKNNLEEMFDDMQHPVKPIAEWPNQLKDPAVACALTDASPQQVFDIVSGALLEEGEFMDLVDSVAAGLIQKDQAWDELMECFYRAAESHIDKEIKRYNEA